ncbi:hypothetical protein AHF37_01569 [Paragonimus kellicotti]|nr:hypothetical protein AHF37_01569 [Paragonimus kellicotti]
MGEEDYRFHQEPFPLYPNEQLRGKVEPLPVVLADSALRLRALCDHTEGDGTERQTCEEWLFEGPGVYYPRMEVERLGTMQAHMIELNTAVRFRAIRDCVDRSGTKRKAGEHWLVTTVGAYLPTVYEEFVCTLTAQKLDEKTAVHVRSIRTHQDRFDRTRKCGDEWLVTQHDADSYLCDINEEMVCIVRATTLTGKHYGVILNPVDRAGKPQLGKKRLVRGEASFFLMPGESLERRIQKIHILGVENGLVLRAVQQTYEESNVTCTDVAPKLRQPGERWLIRGPCEYVPPVGIEVVEKRTSIPLGESEGIYVRNMQTGEVRVVTGTTYMLTEDEEHWEKKLPTNVRELLESDKVPFLDRSRFAEICCQKMSLESQNYDYAECEEADEYEENSFTLPEEPKPFPVVSLQVPHNAAAQVNDYRQNKSRVEFGPVLVMLGPHEQFTLLNLSGGKPKRPNVVKSLYLLLGPDFVTDMVVVETADHARLSLQLSYNWIFHTAEAMDSQAEADKLFSVPDFVGDTCKAMASRIRGAVASITFDNFHKAEKVYNTRVFHCLQNSARIIRVACLGLDSSGKVQNSCIFSENRLRITGVDIQAVAPTDERTRELLTKSVQMAIEITTSSLEAAARHEATRLEQEARGRLERQKILDETEVQKSKKKLLEMQITAAALASTGEAKAKALAQAESERIKGLSAVEQSTSHVEADRIKMEAELQRLERIRQLELSHTEARHALKLKLQQTQAQMEASRFSRMVKAVSQHTLGLMATAGAEHDVQMLQALGLHSTLITDGSAPINLFTTAAGLLGHDIECEEADEYEENSFTLPEEPKPFPVVSLQVPHNAAAQVNDYRQNKSRVEFGPVLVMLGPHEQFTLLNLSGGKPKRPNVVKSLYLLLGPDFVTDMVVVETADHARLSLQLSYNWIFHTAEAMDSQAEADKLFSVPDFVGDTCKAMASRIRGAVASITFDNFHKAEKVYNTRVFHCLQNSARIIRVACLGLDSSGKVQNSCIFSENRLRITGVDIQAVAPTDERTRELLTKSVQMAIEITTSSLEAAARHEATRLEQEARGRLERQKILDETEVQKSKKKLLEMQITAAALASTGEAKAKALAQAESERIKGLSAVEQSTSHVEADRIKMVC